jgi:hypothetical protein
VPAGDDGEVGDPTRRAERSGEPRWSPQTVRASTATARNAAAGRTAFLHDTWDLLRALGRASGHAIGTT